MTELNITSSSKDLSLDENQSIPKSLTIDERVHLLETKTCPKSRLVGTSLTRCQLPDSDGKMGWTLGIGMFQHPKIFYTGASIEEVLAQAESDLKSD